MAKHPVPKRFLLLVLALLLLTAAHLFYNALWGGFGPITGSLRTPSTLLGRAFMQYADVPDSIAFSVRYVDVPSDIEFSMWFVEPTSPQDIPTVVPSR